MQEMDLRQEVMARLNDPETRQRIADALILEAAGGPPDPKSGVPKGGATVIRAFELIREIALERPPLTADAPDFSRYTDIELIATLTRLEAEEGAQSSGGAAQGIADGGERARSPPGNAGGERERGTAENAAGGREGLPQGNRERGTASDGAEMESGGGYG